jgi:Xaa-Pro aminopeptidase
MFFANVYIERRKLLRNLVSAEARRAGAGKVQSGLILFLGNQQSPINFADNHYPFRQDSSFLYFWGLDFPDLAAVIDIDEEKECVFGNDLTMDDIIWTGPQLSLKEKCTKVGISETAALDKLQEMLTKAIKQGREIAFLPQYRPENVLRIGQLLSPLLRFSKQNDGDPAEISRLVCEPLIKAVVAQRSIKQKEEVEQIESAIDITCQMQMTAMKMSKPGLHEREIAGAMEAVAISSGSRLAFPSIFSVHGQTLHNTQYLNLMRQGDIAINDCGAESALGYASDITRTIPVGGRFSQRQKEIYSVVLNAQKKSIDVIKPGVEFRDVHRLACRILASGLTDLGLMKGNMEEAIDAGAHTLFFPCGLGHMLGLDVHDMESLGEDYVGYTDAIKRKAEFGWKSLRLAKALEPGFVITVEPGIYFIPDLIDRWKAEQKCIAYINYNMVEKYRDFGGIRIEDDVLVTENGCRILGKPIPKTIYEVEEMSASTL